LFPEQRLIKQNLIYCRKTDRFKDCTAISSGQGTRALEGDWMLASDLLQHTRPYRRKSEGGSMLIIQWFECSSGRYSLNQQRSKSWRW